MLNKYLHKKINEKFLDWCSDYNSLEVRRSCRSKKQARDMFDKWNVPYAKWSIFFSPLKAVKFVKEYWFPVCIKPNVWGYSRGSYFPINNWKEFWVAIIWAKKWWPTSVIEEYLLGKNYRVGVTKDSVDVVMQRFPAFVIWDWLKTIWTLVDEENQIRKDMKLLPVIHEIERSAQIIYHLKKQWLTFDSIPKLDENVTLFHRVALSPGWVLENVELDKVTPKNKELFIKILDLFKANVFWIDVIMEKWIDVDYDKQKTIFLEVNSRPYMKMHWYPRYWKKPDLTEMYKKLDGLEIKSRDIF